MTSEKTVSRSEDGEFELILGNRQLLSVFFIVVVLLGVFFTMGYIVGKNAVNGADLAARRSDPVVVDPSKPSSFGSEPKPVAARSTPAAEVPATRPEDDARAVRRQEAERKEAERRADLESKAEARRLAEEEKKTEAARQETERKAEAERRAEARKNEAKEAPVRTAAATAPIPLAGQQFLQVVASSKPDCEIIADVLRRKGFGASVVAGPSEKVFRVVVGPLADAGAITRTRNDLEAAGFQKPILKKF